MGKSPAHTTWRVTNWRELVGLDKRSVALFRVCLGLIVFVDSLDRIHDARDFYSDEGIYPREATLKSHWNYYWLSIHMMNGSTIFQQLLFFLNALSGLSMAVGYRTFLSTFLTWLFVSSYHARNNLVNHGGDVYMRIILFWALFMPLSSCYSIDRWMGGNRRRVKKYLSMSYIGGVSIIVQVCVVYISSYFHKYGDEWHVYGTSTQFALKLDYFRLPLGDLIAQFPALMKFFTFAVLYFEAVGVLLFFVPVFTQQLRTLGVILFVLMHAGFGACMGLGIFSFISSTAVIAILPAWFWDRLVFPLLSKSKKHIDIWYYEGTPGEKMATFVVDFLLLPDSCTLHKANNELHDEKFFWMAVQRDGETITRFEAFVEICKVSPLLWPIRTLMRIKPFFLLLKKQFMVLCTIAPYYLSDEEKPANPHQKNKRLNRARKVLVSTIGVFLACYIVVWNCGNFGSYSKMNLPNGSHWVGYTFRIEQMWNMFSPHPPKINWWYSIEGKLDDGREVEIWLNGLQKWEPTFAPYSIEKPTNLGEVIGNHRWIKFYEFLNWGDSVEVARLNYGRYICREYNARNRGKNRLYTFELIFHSEQNQLFGPNIPLKRIVYWSHMCYDKK